MTNLDYVGNIGNYEKKISKYFPLFGDRIFCFLAALGLRCCLGFSLVVESGGLSLVVPFVLLIAVAPLVARHGP